MSEGVLQAPRKLERGDDRTAFESGAAELDTWLKKYAWQNQRANNSVTYVAMLDGVIIGYYAIASAAVARGDVDESFARGRPDPIPCILLARLAVDRRAQGRGVGAGLLRDALMRTLNAADSFGAAALLIHCRDDAAREFYIKNSGAVPSPIDELQLLIPLKWISKQLRP